MKIRVWQTVSVLCRTEFYIEMFVLPLLQGFKCPRCDSGFIEEMGPPPLQPSSSDESSDEGDEEPFQEVSSLLYF